MIFNKKTVIAGALVISTVCFAQTTRSLNLTKGSQYSIAENTTTHSTTKMMGKDVKTDLTVTSTYQLSVDGLTGNDYDLTGVVKDVKMSLNQAGQSLSYDSQHPDSSSPLASVMNGSLNKPQKIRITKQNELVPDPKATVNLASPLAEAQRRGFGSQVAFVAIPANIKVGDSFNITTNDKPTATKMDLKYKVKSVSDGFATLEYGGTTMTDGVVKSQGIDMDTKTRGTVAGQAVVDMKTGVVQNADVKSQVTGTVSAMGQEMPLTVETESKITVTKL